MSRILLVDDEPAVVFMLREVLEERGHEVLSVESGEEALGLADRGDLEETDLVLTDFAMPGMDGLALLSALRRSSPELPTVLLTARGSERLAVRAIRAGAFDYLPKPVELDELEAVVARALEVSGLRRDVRRARAQVLLGRAFLGQAPAFRRVVDRALKLAGRDVPVLVTGETGTGKELLATLLHTESERRRGPLVRFNCAALASDVAESELFGHVRGAFTGAHATRRGLFAEADGGTLVLDEIGELAPSLQPKLLRALQFGELQPVGGSMTRVDVRVVACTHRDLRAEVKAGRFREDLLYRLAVVELAMPPLRERREDIPLLAEVFARQAADRFGLEAVTLAPELRAALVSRDYPGNVRELENLMLQLVALSDGGVLGPDALGSAGPSTDAPPRLSLIRAPGPSANQERTLRAQLEALERALITDALARSEGNQSQAARELGLSRTTLLDKLKRLSLA